MYVISLLAPELLEPPCKGNRPEGRWVMCILYLCTSTRLHCETLKQHNTSGSLSVRCFCGKQCQGISQTLRRIRQGILDLGLVWGCYDRPRPFGWSARALRGFLQEFRQIGKLNTRTPKSGPVWAGDKEINSPSLWPCRGWCVSCRDAVQQHAEPQGIGCLCHVLIESCKK